MTLITGALNNATRVTRAIDRWKTNTRAGRVAVMHYSPIIARAPLYFAPRNKSPIFLLLHLSLSYYRIRALLHIHIPSSRSIYLCTPGYSCSECARTRLPYCVSVKTVYKGPSNFRTRIRQRYSRVITVWHKPARAAISAARKLMARAVAAFTAVAHRTRRECVTASQFLLVASCRSPLKVNVTYASGLVWTESAAVRRKNAV